MAHGNGRTASLRDILPPGVRAGGFAQGISDDTDYFSNVPLTAVIAICAGSAILGAKVAGR